MEILYVPGTEMVIPHVPVRRTGTPFTSISAASVEAAAPPVTLLRTFKRREN